MYDRKLKTHFSSTNISMPLRSSSIYVKSNILQIYSQISDIQINSQK